MCTFFTTNVSNSIRMVIMYMTFLVALENEIWCNNYETVLQQKGLVLSFKYFLVKNPTCRPQHAHIVAWHFVTRDLWLCLWIRELENMNKSSCISKGCIITENKSKGEKPRTRVVWTRVISTRRMGKLSQGTGWWGMSHTHPPFCLKNKKLTSLSTQCLCYWMNGGGITIQFAWRGSRFLSSSKRPER